MRSVFRQRNKRRSDQHGTPILGIVPCFSFPCEALAVGKEQKKGNEEEKKEKIDDGGEAFGAHTAPFRSPRYNRHPG